MRSTLTCWTPLNLESSRTGVTSTWFDIIYNETLVIHGGLIQIIVKAPIDNIE